MFKVKKDTNKTTHVNKTFRFPTDLVNTLQLVAQKENVSLNKLVIQCCQYALENLDQEADRQH